MRYIIAAGILEVFIAFTGALYSQNLHTSSNKALKIYNEEFQHLILLITIKLKMILKKQYLSTTGFLKLI